MIEISGLPTKFEKAIAYLKQKSPLPSQKWDEITNEAQDFAFTLAGIEKASVLQSVQDELTRVLEGKSEIDSFKAFSEKFEDVMVRNGYGKVNPWRSKLVYTQNISTAYAAGRTQEAIAPGMLKSYPYWQYHTGYPLEPRPHHKAMDGKVFRVKDILKAKWGLPSGFLCRCRWQPVSEADLKAEGLTVSEIPDRVTVRDRVTGKSYQVPAISIKGKIEPLIDAGFLRVPGLSEDYRQEIIEESKSRLNPKLRKIL